MRRIPFLILLLVFGGCAIRPSGPVCSEQYRQGLLKSLAYWELQPSEFYGYDGAVENLNYKVKQFNYFCAKKEYA